MIIPSSIIRPLLVLFFLGSFSFSGTTQELSKNQRKAIRWGNQSDYHLLSQEDGPYLIVNFGMRREGKSSIPNLEFSNLSVTLG